MSKLVAALGLLAVTAVNAASGIPEASFQGQGWGAAVAAAPMWHMASGSCLPSAAEDGNGHQTDGVNPGADCLVGAYLGNGCPGDSTWRGSGNVWYHNVGGEPFGEIPTYYKVAKCDDNSWRVYYEVYFKKDTGHKSDWEWAIMKWTQGGDGKWYRNGMLLSVHGRYGGGRYDAIPNTFNGVGDWEQDGNRDREFPKLYFGKHKHSVHWDKSANFKSNCPPADDDFRANDFQFWSLRHLRHVDNIQSWWSYGAATNPHWVNICDNRGVSW